jgi:hypothetical protein
MKKIELLIVGLLSCVFSIAQQIPSNDIAHIDLPSNAQRLSHKQVDAVVDSGNYYLEFIKNTRNDTSELYMIDSFILWLYGAGINLSKNYLNTG